MEIKKQLSVYVLCLFACTFFFTGCKKDVYDPNKDESQSNDFGYETRSVKSLDIDYGIEGYKAVFEIYTENPISIGEDGAIQKKEDVTASFKAYTNEDCQYKGSINLPSATEKVYLYSENVGLPECIELEVSNDGIKFDRDEYSQTTHSNAAKSTVLASRAIASRAAEDNPHNILAPLGNWSRSGIPDYIIKDERGYPIQGNTPEGLLTRLNASIRPEDAGNGDIKVLKDNTTIDLVFLDGKGTYINTLGYYYYEEEPGDIEALPKYVAFPWSNSTGTGYLWEGNKIHLKYFGKDGLQEATDEFPKGVTIGWFILVNGFNNPTNNNATLDYKKPIRYSNEKFNKNQTKYCARYYDEETETSAITFEDYSTSDPTASTYDYKDVVFYLDVTKGIIEIGGKPTGPGTLDPIESEVTSGTLAFEDLWPNKGDYDMNDVVITYEQSYISDKDNNILSLKNTYTPVHNGGQIQSAFGYQIDIPQTRVLDVKMTNNNTSSAQVDAMRMEKNQDKVTFILFDDMKQAVKNGPITIEITLDKGLTVQDIQNNTKFYNPFICVNRNKGENPVTAESRREIHLTNYPPTSLAGTSFDFGRYDDRSDINSEKIVVGPRYYVGDLTNPYPFAIDLPITDYKIPTEAMSIDKFYPNFKEWTTSHGVNEKDWYNHPAK